MESGKAGVSEAAGEILALVQAELCEVEREISLQWVTPVDAITAIGKYMQAAGGKRLRPTLVLLTAKLFGGAGQSAIRLGAVVEMIHTATLVHDDVIDDASTRRGRASPNFKWGNHTAVLAGDWLYMQAFQVALRERDFRILDLLIAVTQTMVEGELLQAARLGSIAVTEADYMDLVHRKTAGLFATCARLGAIVGGADEAAEKSVGEYAWNLGMAFQLIDDVLDFTAHENVLGKPVGNDLAEGKVTLPLIYALETAAAGERALVATVLEDRSYDRVPFAEIRDLIDRHCGIDRARERAGAFTERARAVIDSFPDSPCQRALASLTGLVTDRAY